ncbi:unnamed protein product [Didymodactylos carnosus]|uniref:Uncharacterized protein n=1 Tax=Didymodactylos carnosus TaxID=1234261 RepID=A0A815UM70_9BILA|nr:unnamed protein product [Didymodactylos carnosus]CAF4375766.1 unnamed protein product [Didymodactylos carnosus]
MIGLVVMLLTSIPSAIDKGVAFSGLIVAMVIIGFGTGGVKIAFLGSIVVLIIGRNKYVQKPPTGTLITRAVQVTMTAIRMRRKLGKQLDRPDIFDYAKDMSSSNDHNENEGIPVLNNNAFIDNLNQSINFILVHDVNKMTG